MNISITPQNLLEQILQIRRLEHGSLSVIRQGPNGPYYNLNSWEEGANQCRYIPHDKLPEVRQAIEGYQKYRQLTEEYARQIVEQTRAQMGIGIKKEAGLQQEPPPPQVLLAQDREIQQLMSRLLATDPTQLAVQELDFEVLLRTAVFKSTNQLMAYLFQKLADRIDAAYQPKPGYVRKGRAELTVDCIFGFFKLERDYYYHEGKQLGHHPTDAALGLEGDKTPALARLACLEGADEASYQKAEEHLKETGGIHISARQIQRLVQQVGAAAQTWQEREALKPLPETKPVPILYISGDATGVPMRKEELEGRAGKCGRRREYV